MHDLKDTLGKLNKNLNILREREAKYGGNAPLELLNQISDHEQAIALTEQALAGDLSETDWREATRPLLLAFQEGQVVNIQITYHITYQMVTPAPVDPATLARAHKLLTELPTDTVPPPATLPPGSKMPFPANPLFVGRGDQLKELARLLKGGQTAAIGQIAAATGLGGIGKTQLATAFVHHYGRYFAGGVYWLSLADSTTVPTEIAACAPPGGEKLELETQVRLVMSQWQSELPRLLVFDNCEEESLLTQWRPPTGGCRVLLTSRRQHWSRSLGVEAVVLPTLPRDKSVELLLKFRPDLTDSPLPLGEGLGVRALDAIAAELGDLPLALHLAGSFLDQYRSVTPTQYLAQLRHPDLLNHPSLQGRGAEPSPTGHALHAAKTFALSYERLHPSINSGQAPDDPIDGLALKLLGRAACLAPGEPIPRELLLATLKIKAESKAEAEEENPALASALALDSEDALTRLVNLGLLEATSGESATLHRLLAAFVRQAQPDPAAQAGVEAALLAEAERLNVAGYPAPLLAWQVHLRHVTDAGQSGASASHANLCNEMGCHLKMVGDYAGARPYFERALAIFEQVLGAEHPDTATSLNNLALLLYAQGDYAGARLYFERALAIYEQVLGPAHPHTASNLNNLAGLLYAQGDYAEARPYFERALAIKEQILGPAHPDTALSLNNLALLLYAQGDYAGARPYYERALAIYEQVLGPAHPDTALSLNNLASLLQAQGDYAGARPYFERALAIYEQVLGPAHPDTALSLNNLAGLLKDQGDYAGARPYFERALAIREQVLGPAHPDTALSLNNLASLLYDQGDYTGARPYFERALAIYEQVLGPAHPHTATSLNNLAGLLKDQGDYAGARPYFERALAIYEQVLGPAHPDTALSLNNLALLLYAQGDYAGARPYCERALAIFEQVLGPAHPDTRLVRANLEALIKE